MRDRNLIDSGPVIFPIALAYFWIVSPSTASMIIPWSFFGYVVFEVVSAYERRFVSLSSWRAASVEFAGGEVRAWSLYSEIIL